MLGVRSSGFRQNGGDALIEKDIKMDFPTGVTVTKEEVYSIKTNVTGITYYV